MILLAMGSSPAWRGLAGTSRTLHLAPEISGKQLELLKEIVPKLSRVAVLGTSTDPGNAQALKETELAAQALKVQLQYLDVRDPKDIETAFQAASKGRADAVLVLASRVLIAHRTQVAELAVKSRLPAIYGKAGICGSRRAYDVRREHFRFVPPRRHVCGQDIERREARRLPVEQPKKFEFMINLKAAKQIGLTIPPNVLARADKVIR